MHNNSGKGRLRAFLTTGRRRLWASMLAVFGLLSFGLIAIPSAAIAAPATVVSLTFDDGNADQMNAVPILQQNNIKGTFYIISGYVGAPNYVTGANLASIAANGNEIGGHTVTHPDLTTVTADEVSRQACNSRVALHNLGYKVTSFAYPYASFNSAVETAVKNCGYNSARSLGDIKSAHSDPGVTALSGAIPPPDPYNLAAVDEIDNTWTLQQMKNVVTAAEPAGGWVPFTFHHICPGSTATCGDGLSISSTNFQAFLTWLKGRPATTSVKTVDQVIGGTEKAYVSGPAGSNGTSVANPSLETAGADPNFPQCWFPGGYGTNTPTWTRLSTGAHTGSFGQKLDMSGYSSGDAKLLPVFDTGGCSPSVTPGSTYTLGAWYKSTVATQFALYYRDANNAWFYWTSSPWFAAATNWTQATWTTPAAPAGATGMSFGLNLFSNGSLTTDDYSITAGAGGAAAATVSTLAAPSNSSAALVAPARAGASHGHHRHWGKNGRVLVPGGKVLRPGQRVTVELLPD